MEGKTILIIEDDEDQQRILADMLRYRHHTVIQAREGLEGARLARESRPDLIIMDVRLPHIDGFSLAEIIKSDEQTAHIPILAITLYDIDIRKIQEAAWDSLRIKPVPTEELLREVDRLLAGQAGAQPPAGTDSPDPAGGGGDVPDA